MLRQFLTLLAGQLILILLLFLVEFFQRFVEFIQRFFLPLGRGLALFEFVAGRFHLLGGLTHRLRSFVGLVPCEPLKKLLGFPAKLVLLQGQLLQLLVPFGGVGDGGGFFGLLAEFVLFFRELVDLFGRIPAFLLHLVVGLRRLLGEGVRQFVEAVQRILTGTFRFTGLVVPRLLGGVADVVGQRFAAGFLDGFPQGVRFGLRLGGGLVLCRRIGILSVRRVFTCCLGLALFLVGKSCRLGLKARGLLRRLVELIGRSSKLRFLGR